MLHHEDLKKIGHEHREGYSARATEDVWRWLYVVQEIRDRIDPRFDPNIEPEQIPETLGNLLTEFAGSKVIAEPEGPWTPKK